MKKKAFYTLITIVALVLLSAMVVGAISVNTVFLAKEKKLGFVEFNYTIKDNYNSIEEIDNALKEVTVIYKRNIEGCSKEYVEKQSAKYQEITKKLVAKKAEFDNNFKSTNDSDKLSLFYQRLSLWKDEYLWLNRFDSSKSEKEQQECERVTQNYNMSLEIKKLYEKGELSLDKAYEQLISLSLKKLTK